MRLPTALMRASYARRVISPTDAPSVNAGRSMSSGFIKRLGIPLSPKSAVEKAMIALLPLPFLPTSRRGLPGGGVTNSAYSSSCTKARRRNCVSPSAVPVGKYDSRIRSGCSVKTDPESAIARRRPACQGRRRIRPTADRLAGVGRRRLRGVRPHLRAQESEIGGDRLDRTPVFDNRKHAHPVPTARTGEGVDLERPSHEARPRRVPRLLPRCLRGFVDGRARLFQRQQADDATSKRMVALLDS